jgi:hypothetical protein
VIAASGLAVASAPNVAEHLHFLRHLAIDNSLGAGVAMTLAPATAAVLFIATAIAIIDGESFDHLAQPDLTGSQGRRASVGTSPCLLDS